MKRLPDVEKGPLSATCRESAALAWKVFKQSSHFVFCDAMVPYLC